MSGLYVGVTLDHRAREQRLFVTDSEEFANSLSFTEYPTVHYEGPVILWDAISDYIHKHVVSLDTGIIIQTTMVKTTGTPVTVGQVLKLVTPPGFVAPILQSDEYDPLEAQLEQERQETLDELNRFDQGMEGL